jgi:hypothetical protein
MPESPLFVASDLAGLCRVGRLFGRALAKASWSFRLALDLCRNVKRLRLYSQDAKSLAHHSESAIKYTTCTYSPPTTQKKPCSSRPHILLLHQKKIIYRKVRAAPKIEYSELAKVGAFVNADVISLKPPSHSTLYQALKRHSLSNFRCKVRPKLSSVHARKQREFCKTYCNFS